MKTLSCKSIILTHAPVFGLVSLLVLQACAPLFRKPPAERLDQARIREILSTVREQENLVNTFFWSGRMVVEENDVENEAGAFVAGSRNPFRIKIELTHAWGRPLLHLVIQGERIRIVSFVEKRYYEGNFRHFGRWRLFPAGLGPTRTWSLLRAYPVLEPYVDAVSTQGNQIALLDREGRVVQRIELDPRTNFPGACIFPRQGLEISFSAFHKGPSILYARETRVTGEGQDASLQMKVKQMVFNRTIPETVFDLEIPPDFEVIPLETRAPFFPEQGENGARITCWSVTE